MVFNYLFTFLSFFLIERNLSAMGFVCGPLGHSPHHTQECGPHTPQWKTKGRRAEGETSRMQDGEWSPVRGKEGEPRPHGEL